MDEAKKESDIERQATEEILRDAQRGASRADSFGSTAWQPSPLPKTNKVFLNRALAGAVMVNSWLGAQKPSTDSRASPKYSRGSPSRRQRRKSPDQNLDRQSSRSSKISERFDRSEKRQELSKTEAVAKRFSETRERRRSSKSLDKSANSARRRKRKSRSSSRDDLKDAGKQPPSKCSESQSKSGRC